jgi:hypothetical protein
MLLWFLLSVPFCEPNRALVTTMGRCNDNEDSMMESIMSNTSHDLLYVLTSCLGVRLVSDLPYSNG